jgi:hypothetical protein
MAQWRNHQNGRSTLCGSVRGIAEEARCPERDGAEDFLRGLLASGRMQVSKIEAEAKAAGLAWATVRRAQANIGIKPNRVGFGKEGIWYWQLSSQSPIGAIDAHLLTKEGGGEHLCENVSAYGKNPIDAHQADDSGHFSSPIDAHDPPPIDDHGADDPEDDDEWELE